MTDYFDRFPAESRAYCERAYQDGYEDGGNDGERIAALRAAGYYIHPCGPNRWRAAYLAPGAESEMCVGYAESEIGAAIHAETHKGNG